MAFLAPSLCSHSHLWTGITYPALRLGTSKLAAFTLIHYQQRSNLFSSKSHLLTKHLGKSLLFPSIGLLSQSLLTFLPCLIPYFITFTSMWNLFLVCPCSHFATHYDEPFLRQAFASFIPPISLPHNRTWDRIVALKTPWHKQMTIAYWQHAYFC